MSVILLRLFFATIFMAFAYGWIANIYHLVTAEALAGMEVARAIGIFVAPFGAVLGYF